MIEMVVFFNKISDIINKVACGLAIVFFLIVIYACFVQVFSRYVMNSSYSWTEETARFAFIWLNMLGATICVKTGAHAMVTALIDILPKNIRKGVDTVTYLLMMYIATLMITQGMIVVGVTARQPSPALGIPMAYIYVCVPICGAIIIVHILTRLAELFLPAPEGRDSV